MRIGVTIESGRGSEDLLLDCDDATTVEEVERSLRAHVGQPVRVPGRRREPAGLTLVNGARLGGRGRRRAALRSRWQLHVVSGPDCGGVWDLVPGDHIVGRSGSICWNDPEMSRRHVTVHIGTRTVEITDLASRHGSRLDGDLCAPGSKVPWPPGATLEVGRSVAILRETPAPDGVWRPAAPGWRQLLRPPRLPAPFEVPEIKVPPPPSRPQKGTLPWAAAAVPMVVGVGIALALRRPEYLLFAIASPLAVLANHAVARVAARRRMAAATAVHERELEEVEGRLARAIAAEERDLRERAPDAASTLLTVLLPGRRLWERRPGDADFLRLRVGCRDQPSGVHVEGGRTADRIARLVPQCIDLTTEAVVGITGAVAVTDGVLRWLVAQLSAHHAPRDLSLVILGVDADPDWAWVRWLPHLRLEPSDLPDLVRTRGEQGASGPPAIVVIVRGYADVSRTMHLADLMTQGPKVGVHVVCSAAVDGELPDEARVVVTTSTRGAQGSLAGAGYRVESMLLEQVSVPWALRCARGLAPFKDAAGDEAAAIPEDVRLLDLIGHQLRTTDVIDGWRSPSRRTTAMLGVTADGPLSLDLTADGPHVLVAGMTGSGKTGLLQTLIASLAIAQHPDRLNFVLIDYKGDSAFQDCARLPHVVGKVTDLTPPLVERALISLRAELARRKVLLAETAVSDIDGYVELSVREPSRPTLPRLVLVIDEFAELARELPDFIDGLVSIAQLGRSLGVHLVLATQRPSGVLSPAIRANTNIRIALRVADPADSVDVVGSADASTIPAGRPGRGCLRVGGRPVTEFQVARASGSAPGSESMDRRQPLIEPLPALGDVQARPRAGRPHDTVDLVALVDRICHAAQEAGVVSQRRPWLEPLPARLPWSRRDAWPIGGPLLFPLGLADLPDRQRQEIASFDPRRDGHLYIVGSARSGRSQTLRLLGAALAEFADPAEVHVYGIDCGAGGLAGLASMPHCGAVVARHEAERVGRLLTRLTSESARRQALPTGDPGRTSPRLVLLIDGWEGFLMAFGEVGDGVDGVTRLLREGAAVGIHLAIAGDRTLIANPRMSAMTEAKYLLRMAERSDYALAGISVRQVNGEMPPGRCFGPGARETQVFWLDREPPCRVATAGPRPFRIDPLPSRIGVTEAMALVPAGVVGPTPIVGVGADTLTAFAPELDKSGWFGVLGPPGSGRSTVLAGAVESAAVTGADVIVIGARGDRWQRLHGRAGVLGVLSGREAVTGIAAIGAEASGGPCLLVIDDVEALASTLDRVLAAARSSLPEVFVMAAGTVEGVAFGSGGWRAEFRSAGQGMLLSPRSVADGDLIGARLPRSAVGGTIQPGRGLLHLGGGVLTPVATLAPSLL